VEQRQYEDLQQGVQAAAHLDETLRSDPLVAQLKRVCTPTGGVRVKVGRLLPIFLEGELDKREPRKTAVRYARSA
jgi:hypothetical protein